jgi:hypothetical protein
VTGRRHISDAFASNFLDYHDTSSVAVQQSVFLHKVVQKPPTDHQKGNTMHAIKEARQLIEKSPDDAAAKILSRLVLALESESDIAISEIYALDMARFELALKILREWRLDRYYAGKARLFDAALLAMELPAQG